MKKHVVAFAAFLIALNTAPAFTAYAKPKETQLFIDGTQINSFFIKDGKAYVPVRDLTHYIGYDVEYNDIEKTINLYKAYLPKPPIKRESSLFPSSVDEITINGRKEIVKVYELDGQDNPLEIPKEDFEKDGYKYTLTDITKNSFSSTDTREHTEIITINTPSNNINDIISQIEKQIEFKTEDGYSGVLELDLSTIQSEVAGYKNSAYTATETREYPNLSNMDTSLIPKSIDVGGKTYALASLNWLTMNTTTIDYTQLPDLYKAVVKYTATGSKSTVTGYTTTAEYKGAVHKTIEGKTLYTAYFSGEEINIELPEPTVNELQTQLKEAKAKEKSEKLGISKSTRKIVLAIGIPAGIVSIASGLLLLFLRSKNVVIENIKDGNWKQVGKTKLTKKKPVINLTNYAEIAVDPSFKLDIGKFTAKMLDGETVVINYGANSMQHTIMYDEIKDKEKYEIYVEF